MTFVEAHPNHEQAGIHAAVIIPKASLVPGGLAVQREMTLALMDGVDLAALALAAIARLEEVVRDRMADDLAIQNERRMAVGLPPLVPAETGTNAAIPPGPPVSDAEPPVQAGDQPQPTPQTASPYRGRRNRPQESAR